MYYMSSLAIFYLAVSLLFYVLIIRRVMQDMRYAYEHDDSDYVPTRMDSFVFSIWWPLVVMKSLLIWWRHRKEPKE